MIRSMQMVDFETNEIGKLSEFMHKGMKITTENCGSQLAEPGLLK